MSWTYCIYVRYFTKSSWTSSPFEVKTYHPEFSLRIFDLWWKLQHLLSNSQKWWKQSPLVIFASSTPIAPAPDNTEVMENWWNILQGKTKSSVKYKPQCHFIRSKSHIDSPRIDPESLKHWNRWLTDWDMKPLDRGVLCLKTVFRRSFWIGLIDELKVADSVKVFDLLNQCILWHDARKSE